VGRLKMETTGHVFKTKHAIPREVLREVDGVL
jgi:hypothetical protein